MIDKFSRDRGLHDECDGLKRAELLMLGRDLDHGAPTTPKIELLIPVESIFWRTLRGCKQQGFSSGFIMRLARKRGICFAIDGPTTNEAVSAENCLRSSTRSR